MKKYKILVVASFMVTQVACTRFLDMKPDKKLVVPETLADLQALLDNFNDIYMDPALGEVSADDYYLLEQHWSGLYSEHDRRAYLWEKEGIYASLAQDWFRPYKNVYYSNIVLETLTRIGRNASNSEAWDHLRGQSLFLRGRSLLSAVVLFSKAYDHTTAQTDLGVPTRLSSDFNVLSDRGTVAENYNQIIADLTEAIDLLPIRPVHVYRSSKPAAMALLARTFLYMRDYEQCLFFADACLQLKSDLLDYNDLDSNAVFPIPEFNEEIIYQSILYAPPLSINIARVDSTLETAYEEGDLRRSVFFRENSDGSWSFKGSYYSTGNNLFSGLAVDEVFLMRAECYARLGNPEKALDDLNALLEKRWDSQMFEKVASPNGEAVLQMIIAERRKELLMRGIRFPDVKRLNADGAHISFRRKIADNTYLLEANSPSFLMPIPEQVITVTGMPQNQY